jgi:hypothetical protein
VSGWNTAWEARTLMSDPRWKSAKQSSRAPSLLSGFLRRGGEGERSGWVSDENEHVKDKKS